MNWIDTITSQSFGKSAQPATVNMVPENRTLASIVINLPKRVIVSVVRGLLNWHHDNVERAELRGLNEHILRDIGITRGQADEMARDRWVRRDIRKAR